MSESGVTFLAMRKRTAFVGLFMAVMAACSQQQEPSALDLDGHRVTPFDVAMPATTLIFVRTDCPISNRYAPEIQRLQDEYGPRGMRLFLVYPDGDETPESIRRHATEYSLSVESLLDSDHELVDHVQATVTPSAAVIVAGQLVYLGHIDNRYDDLGKARAAASRQSLREVLDAVAAGQVPPLRHTRAVGCLIADLK